MIIQKLSYAFPIILALSCNSNSPSPSKPELINKTAESINSIEEYILIKQIEEIDGKIYIDADHIQYLTGDKAIEAARKANEADSFRTENGEIEYSVPNDYYILNENSKIKHISFANNCAIELVINHDKIPPIKESSFENLKKVYADNPFIITLNSKGEIIKVKEVFTP